MSASGPLVSCCNAVSSGKFDCFLAFSRELVTHVALAFWYSSMVLWLYAFFKLALFLLFTILHCLTVVSFKSLN